MKLTRPIVFFDIEATGLDTLKDRIVQICFIKLHPDGLQETKTRMFNPQIPIHQEAIEIHGITNEMVAQLEPFRRYAKGMHDWIQGCDIGGFNSNRFDIPMLFNEFERSGVIWDWKQHHLVDTGNLYKIARPRTLVAAYEEITGKELTDAHDAEADVKATIDVNMGLIQQHEEWKDKTVEELALISNYDKEKVDLNGKFSLDEDGDIIFNFGKDRGGKAKNNTGLLYWILDKDFPEDTKNICRELLGNN